MTITTAKLAGAVHSAWQRPLALPLALAAMLLAPSARADWTFTPTLTARETFTDNYSLESKANANSAFIHEIRPGMRASHRGPRLVFNGLYEIRYFFLPDRDIPGTDNRSQLLKADAKASLLDELLYLDASASIQQQNVSPFAQLTDNGFITRNSTEVRTWRISPYLVQRFGTTASSEVRYTRDSVAANQSGFGDSVGDTLSFRLNSGPSFKRFTWNLDASEQKIDEELRNDSTISTANLALRYRFGRSLSVIGGVGYDDYDYQSLGGANSGRAWNVGAIWSPSPRTTVQATNGRRYFGPSRTLNATHRSRHTVWSLGYSDVVSTTRSNFLIPSAVDTAALLDGLFLPVFPDPVERARAVEEYIRLNNLPPALADNINYLSNRFMLQKQMRASVGYRAARTTGTVSLFRVERNALSTRETDSILLGSNLNAINDNVKQVGINTNVNYALSPRTSLMLDANVSDNESLTTSFKSRSHLLRFSGRHQLRPKMFGTVELRHVKGNTSLLVASPYTENAVSASLTMQL